MSQSLPTVDLSTATIGQRGTVDWQQQTNQSVSASGYSGTQVHGATGQAPKLQIFNESGCGLQITLSTSEQLFIPAGGWLQVEVQPSCTSYEWLVLYAIPNPPVSSLINIYYYPYETPPNTPILGNSPVGIGGSVSTVQTQAIKNDGSAPATSIIEATPSDQINSSWALNNDASGVLQVLSANTLKKILNVVRGNATTGKAVIDIGDTADKTITTYHGILETLSCDAGKITSDGSGNLTLTGFILLGAAESSSQTQLFYTHGNLATVLNSPQAGAAALGVAFGVWTGAAQTVPLSLGGQFVGAKSWIESNGLARMGSFDNGTATLRASANYKGTTDPSTYATINEGDTWDKG